MTKQNEIELSDIIFPDGDKDQKISDSFFSQCYLLLKWKWMGRRKWMGMDRKKSHDGEWESVDDEISYQ